MRFPRQLFILAFVFFTTLFTLPALANDIPKVDRIIIFGDSLSDNGNLYHTAFGIIPKSPPYYQGRFANGPIWADIMSDTMAKTYNVTTDNYAVGGETVNFHNPLKGFLPYTFKDSLNSYYFHYFLRDKSHTLFVIWLGANDYLHGVENKDLKTEDQAKTAAAATAQLVTATIKTGIEGLIASGGKSFLLINLPDLADVPFAKPVTPMERLVYHYLTLSHNEQMEVIARDLQQAYPDIRIRVFNFNEIFGNLLTHLDEFNQRFNTHIKNLSDSCWTGGYVRKLAMTTQAQVDEIRHNLENDYNKRAAFAVTGETKSDIDFNALAQYVASNPDLITTYNVSQSASRGGSPCAQPDEYAFWDAVHPTAVAHMIMAHYLNDEIGTFLSN